MPTYHVTVVNLELTDDSKCAVAEAITRAHADHTGAPAYFVQVIFTSVTRDDHFIGGKTNTSSQLHVLAHIREGRSQQVKTALIEKIISDSSEILKLRPHDIWVYIQDLKAEQMAEFGRILPAPGDEAAWRQGLSSKKIEQLEQAGVKI